MSIASLVKGCPLFHEIYDGEVEEVIKSCFVASYGPGDYIIKQGDTGTDICVLLSGKADILVDTSKGQKYIATLEDGDLFGEMVLINETERTANIVCQEPSDVLVITYEDFYSFFKKKPEVFSLMVLNVTRLITKRLKNSNKIIESLNRELDNYKKPA